MTVEVVAHEGWAELILNRPERKNAVTGPLGIELARQVNVLAADDDVRVILLRGAEGAFCSGLDLKEFNADPPPDWLSDFAKIWRSVHRALFNCSKPIVGALERYAINGGAALALACDLLVVGEEAFLQVGEVQQGMAAPYNVAWLNLRHSEAVAAQIALVGRRLHGRELVGLGAAYSCVPDEEVVGHATALAEQLAGYPSGALARIKAGLRSSTDISADAMFDRVIQADPLPSRLAPRAVDRES